MVWNGWAANGSVDSEKSLAYGGVPFDMTHTSLSLATVFQLCILSRHTSCRNDGSGKPGVTARIDATTSVRICFSDPFLGMSPLT